jgi:transcriptional antiterminator RfaH
MTTTDEPAPGTPDPRWYCVRTLTKAEHLAAARLRRLDDVETCCPRIRFRRPTRRGPVWFTEALFPSYLFARLDLRQSGKAVLYTAGVRGIVRFGERYAEIPPATVAALRAEMQDGDLRVVDPQVKPGDTATVIDGPLKGIEAVVTQVLPARDRVRILLDFLGRAMETELDASALVLLDARPTGPAPARSHRRIPTP